MPHRDATLGLYVSIPFCKAKCSFCNFASDAFPPTRMEAYVGRLCSEIAASRAFAADHDLMVPALVDSVFLGGGTPSLLEPPQMASLFGALHAAFCFTENAEITVEAAPGQISDELLDVLLRSGVNRISLGVQSFVDVEARAVGRMHTRESCIDEIKRLRAAGIANINVDLIAGLPHQTIQSWDESMRIVAEAGVQHVSVYMLEVDDDSRLGRELIGEGVRYGAHVAPTESLVSELYAHASERLEAVGLRQYEISNFARDGFQSHHNRKYWQRDAYLGFGLDAHSMLRSLQDGRAARFANADDLDTYMGAGDAVDVERIERLGEWEETIFLGLRLLEGVPVSRLRAEYPVPWVDAFVQRSCELANYGLMQCEGDRILLTQRGRLVSSSVFGELLAEEPATV